MKATLTFDLDDPDDRMAHMRATKSLDLALALWVLTNNSKVMEKFKMATPEMFDVHEAWQEEIREVMEQHGILIDELIR